MLLRLRRLHEPSTRPPGRPSPGGVEAGGYGSGRRKRNGPPRIDKRPRSKESMRNPSPTTRQIWVPTYEIYLQPGIKVVSLGWFDSSTSTSWCNIARSCQTHGEKGYETHPATNELQCAPTSKNLTDVLCVAKRYPYLDLWQFYVKIPHI